MLGAAGKAKWSAINSCPECSIYTCAETSLPHFYLDFLGRVLNTGYVHNLFIRVDFFFLKFNYFLLYHGALSPVAENLWLLILESSQVSTDLTTEVADFDMYSIRYVRARIIRQLGLL